MGKLITRLVKCVTIKIYSTNFDQCHVTNNHYKDYSDFDRQEDGRSPLSLQTANSFNRRLNITHSLIVSTCERCELINETRFWSILNALFLI